jgi:kumamolisin
VAASDQGSGGNVNNGKVQVDFPASSPYILAFGGTRLIAKDNKISDGTV